jgi:hypothetical protein
MKRAFQMALLTSVLVPAVLAAQPVSVNGQIGSEWNGITPVAVGYNDAAPTSNFQAPTNENHITGYDILMRADANWLYTALRTTGGRTSGGLLFSNLYYSVRTGPGTYGDNGVGIGFETVLNDRAFRPGFAGYYDDTGAANSGTDGLIRWATSSGVGQPDIIEIAINLSVFLGNTLNVAGYVAPINPVGIRLNLSQSFGYSVAGGQSFYGDPRLGFVALPQSVVPEPSTYALMAAGLAAMGLVARRRRGDSVA